MPKANGLQAKLQYVQTAMTFS